MWKDGDRTSGTDVITSPKVTSNGIPQWVAYSEPSRGLPPDIYELVEFDITTDPTEAPADALLEAAGYYVEPGDRIAVGRDFPFSTVAHWRADGTWAHDLRVLERGGWDPYSWDVKPEPRVLFTIDFSKGEIVQGEGLCWTAVNAARPTKAPCAQCNGSGRVDGFLGVGIQIPCGECGGEGGV